MCVNKKVVAMSSAQLGEQIRYFVMLRKQYIREGQWTGYSKLQPSCYMGMLNGEIKDSSEQEQELWEQCASYPGIQMLIKRPTSIRINYTDENLDDYFDQQFDGFEARVIQHEFDHYFGYDYLSKSLAIQITDPVLREKHQQ